MPSIPTRSPWDFSTALELLHTPLTPDQEHVSLEAKSHPALKTGSAGLGDFSQIWEVLGTSPSSSINGYTVPDPAQPPAPPPRDDTYASDGAYHSVPKNVSWKDEPDVLEATDVPTTPTSEEGASHNHSVRPIDPIAQYNAQTATPNTKLSKKERKREKKLRQALRRQEEELVRARRRKVTSDIESESEIRILARPTPAVRASKHSRPPSQASLLVPKAAGDGTQANSLQDGTAKVESHKGDETAKGHKAKPKVWAELTPAPTTPVKRIGLAQKDVFGGNLLPTSVPQPHQSAATPQSLQSQPGPTTVRQVTSVHMSAQQVPPFPSFLCIVPAQVVPSRDKRKQTQHTQYMVKPYICSTSDLNDIHPKPKHFHRPPHEWYQVETSSLDGSLLTVSSSQTFQILQKSDRELQLFLRLVHEFSEAKQWLTKPVPLADHNSSVTGIHVFVDFSNIWIGFMDHLKNLQVQMHQHIPHQNISFDALVLLLERKRPVAKRVLAGSYPLLPAMELAKQIGYETLILEKVYKSREPSERQRRILALQARNSFAALGTQDTPQTPPRHNLAAGATSALTPTPSYFPPMPAPEKWVEQAVDEVLHLKILESIVDSDDPSTMVVATGDAAKAEYSEGFMKMIVRALKKGWSVELVAFSKSISSEYRSASFLNTWKSKFRIIMLDEWAQYLLDT